MKKFSKSDIERLRKKRELLKQLRKERSRIESLRDLTSVLDENSIAYEIILEDDDLANEGTPCNWLNDNFPFLSWGKIDANNVSDSQVLILSDYNDDSYTDLLNKFVNKESIKSEFVYVIWANGGPPTIKLKFSDVVEYAFDIFEESLDTWIVCPEDNWCIENHHIGEIGFFPAKNNKK